MKTNLLRLLALSPALAIGLGLSASLSANETSARAESAASEVTGDAAQAAMKELDLEIDRLDVLMNNAPTAEEKASAEARLQTLKDRRSELRKTYVKARYDQLKTDVRAEANRLGAWTKRTFTRDSVDRTTDDVRDSVRDARNNAYADVSTTGAAMDLAAYKLRPTDTNKEEAKAALKALDARIEALDDRVDKMPRGAERDAAKQRVKALEDRKDELKHEFNKARFDALIDSVQAEWNDLIH